MEVIAGVRAGGLQFKKRFNLFQERASIFEIFKCKSPDASSKDRERDKMPKCFRPISPNALGVLSK